MKNIFVGLIIGILITVLGFKLLDHQPNEDEITLAKETQSSNAKIHTKKLESAIPKLPQDQDAINEKVTSSSINAADIENLSVNELKNLVSSYQGQIEKLSGTVKAQKEAIQKLNTERETSNPLESENLNPEQATAALINIRAAIETADPEYKEVLESALTLYRDEKLITPNNDALLRHYAETPDIQWATSAQAWLQSYFQSGLNEDELSLIQLNCRASYCELYGFYGSNQSINDYRIPAAKISNFFRGMSDTAGYSALFRNAENISLNTSSDNTFMSFHVFIRSIN